MENLINFCKFGMGGEISIISNMFSIHTILTTRDREGNTPLMLCIISQNLFSFNFIIQALKTARISETNSTFLNTQNMHGHTALHISLMLQHREISQELIKIGCHPLATDSEFKNAYHYIADFSLSGFARIIHESLLAKFKNAGIVEEIEFKLLSSKDSEGLTPINLAINRQQNINLLSELTGPTEGTELRGKDRCLSIKTGKCQSTALHLVANTGDIRILEYILLKAPRFNNNEFIDEENGQGNTALHIAVANNNLEMVDTLVRNGAYPRVSNGENKMPIDYCISVEMAKLLS